VKKLDEWAKDRPIALAIIAQQIAVSAEPCSEFLKLLKVGELFEGYYRLPSSKEWLRLYKNHRLLYEYLIKLLKSLVGLLKLGLNWLKFCHSTGKT